MSCKSLGHISGCYPAIYVLDGFLKHWACSNTNLVRSSVLQVKQYKNGKEVKTDLMVMENLLFGRNITRKYDLKGSIFSRYVSDVNDPEKVFLDQNFIEDM